MRIPLAPLGLEQPFAFLEQFLFILAQLLKTRQTNDGVQTNLQPHDFVPGRLDPTAVIIIFKKASPNRLIQKTYFIQNRPRYGYAKRTRYYLNKAIGLDDLEYKAPAWTSIFPHIPISKFQSGPHYRCYW